jgi:hypothetical protein
MGKSKENESVSSSPSSALFSDSGEIEPEDTSGNTKIVPANILGQVKIFPYYLFPVEEETEEACNIENWRPCENELILEILLPTGRNNVFNDFPPFLYL